MKGILWARLAVVLGFCLLALAAPALSAETAKSPDEGYKRGLVGIVESIEGTPTHVVLVFHSRIDKEIWEKRVAPLLAGKYGLPPTATIGGGVRCKSDTVMRVEVPEGACGPSSITIDGKAATGTKAYPLAKGDHAIEIKFGRHNADKAPGVVTLKTSDGRMLPFYSTQAMRDVITGQMPEDASGVKMKPKIVVTP